MTYTYLNGNKENPKYFQIIDESNESVEHTTMIEDIPALTDKQDNLSIADKLIKLIHNDIPFTINELKEVTTDSATSVSSIKGQLCFYERETINDFNMVFHVDGNKVIVDKYEIIYL